MPGRRPCPSRAVLRVRHQCGICGIAGHVDVGILHRMTRAMVHRGPDDEGVFQADGTGLGVRRLSIIDVPGGHQPIANEDGSVVVAFNGEIYNHRELRTRPEGQGHRFPWHPRRSAARLHVT